MANSINQKTCPTRHAVILAAGESRRTRPLTLSRPKPLITLAGQPMLAHIIDELVGIVDHVTLVVGYRAEDIQACFGSLYRDIRLHYVRQQQINGTAGALLAVAEQINEPFFLLYGDNLISRIDLLGVCQERYSMAALRVEDCQSFGILDVLDGSVQRILEKPDHVIPDALGNPGIYHLDAQVFPLLKDIRPSPRGEYELTDLIERLAHRQRVAYHLCVGHWIPVGTSWDVLVASLFLLGQTVDQVVTVHPAASIPADCQLRGAVRIGHARLGSGCHIEGPVMIGNNVVIGADCVIKHAVLENGVTVGDNCVVEQSVLGAGVSMASECVVQHSVLDDQVRLGPQVRLESRHFAEVVPTAHILDGLDPDLLRRRGVVIGPGVILPEGTCPEAGSVLFPPDVKIADGR